MAAGTLTVTAIKGVGVAATTLASPTATDGDTFINDGTNTFLMIKNASASPITASVQPSATATAGYDDTLDITVPANSTILAGKFPIARFGATATVICSAVTSVTIGAFKL